MNHNQKINWGFRVQSQLFFFYNGDRLLCFSYTLTLICRTTRFFTICLRMLSTHTISFEKSHFNKIGTTFFTLIKIQTKFGRFKHYKAEILN